MADIRQKAVATAGNYDQGNIKGLDDATTRRLVASTVLTESYGGDLGVTNRQGYVGRYQAGAGWLADAGYVKADRLKAAMDASGHKSEWAWAKSGGMTAFLQEPSNWNNGLTLDSYKASGDLQDRAFRINCDKTYDRAIKAGVLHEGDPPLKVAGFLKARHISGYGGAVAAATGGRVYRDSNGTSNYDYMHDITRNRDGLNQYLTAGAQSQAPATHAAGAGADGRLKQGESGPEIIRLQQRLNGLGYRGADGRALAEDGDFGANTRAAVVKFQLAHGLEGLGMAGPKTMAALDAAEKARARGGSSPAPVQGGFALDAAYDMSVRYDDVKYGFGSKNLASGKVDCSGWVSQLQNATMDEINRKSGAAVFAGKDYFDKGNQSAADIIRDSVQTTGTLMRSPLDRSRLKEGMIIGEDNGEKGWDKGRYNGIDHITMVVKDPKTGALMISQSRGGEGVELSPLDRYLQYKQSHGVALFATDPLAKARPLIEGTSPVSTQSPPHAAAGMPLLSDPRHPDNALYQQAMKGVLALPGDDFRSVQARENAAATIAFEAKVAGLAKIDVVAANGAGYLFAADRALDDPAARRVAVDQTQAMRQTVGRSSELAEQLSKPAPAQDAPSNAQPKQDTPTRAM